MVKNDVPVCHYALCVAYDGTDYCGWQEQANLPTVAGTLKQTFERVFNHPVSLVGASRTDGGVHALGQVARLTTPFVLEPPLMHRALNNTLPHDFHIRSLVRVDRSFHPQRNIHEKVYQYYFSPKRPLPGFSRFCTRYSYPFDREKLEVTLKNFEGTHDFWSFAASDETEACGRSTLCTIHRVQLTYLPHPALYRITIAGDRFLYHMVRRMVGASFAIAASSKKNPDDIKEALEKQMPRENIQTAAPTGLVLRKIIYRHDAAWCENAEYSGINAGFKTFCCLNSQFA